MKFVGKTEILAVTAILVAVSCGNDSLTPDTTESDISTSNDADTGKSPVIPPIRVVTFNTGTTESMGRQSDQDRYTEWMAEQSDEYYGDGLAWVPAVEAARDFLAKVDADIVVFQEIFHSEECDNIPDESKTGFVCETWQTGDPTVAQVITGEGWQVMCNRGKPDKCGAVRKSFGRFAGCDSDFCLEGLEGYSVETCGKGTRVGRGTIELVDGGEITLINVHGSSGFKEEDMYCRTKQFEQIFEDFGDGSPAANGSHNIIMGDFNTDPGRAVIFDPSAARLIEFVGPDKKFHFVTDVGEDVTPTYGGVGNIDHVISNSFEGSCLAAGIDEGYPAVIVDSYFDHVPIVCDMAIPDSDQAGD